MLAPFCLRCRPGFPPRGAGRGALRLGGVAGPPRRPSRSSIRGASLCSAAAAMMRRRLPRRPRPRGAAGPRGDGAAETRGARAARAVPRAISAFRGRGCPRPQRFPHVRPPRPRGERQSCPPARAGPCGTRTGRCSASAASRCRSFISRAVGKQRSVTQASAKLGAEKVPIRKYLPNGGFRVSFICNRPFERSFRFLEGSMCSDRLFLLIFHCSVNYFTFLQMCWS